LKDLRGDLLQVRICLRQQGTLPFLFFVFAVAEREDEA
jgi:hypothetical protein